jgi:thiol-disulfide isomerase/thioredoxin
MKTKFRTASLLAISILVMLLSCSKEKEMTSDEFISNLIADIEIDLSKINTQAVVPTESDKALRAYSSNFELLRQDIDSLLALYPDSYDLKALKINFMRSNPQESTAYVRSLYESDSLNSHYRYFYGMSKSPAEGKDYFVKMVKDSKDNAFGYLGLSLNYLYSRGEDLQVPAKLAYLSILKDHTIDDSFEILNYIFSAMNRTEDAAVLNGIMLVKDPSDSRAFDNLFYHYFETGEKERSKELLEVFIKNNPGTLSNTSIAERYLDLGISEQAEAHVKLARDAKEIDTFLDFVESKLKLSSDMKDESVSLLEKYAKANANDRNLIYRLTDEAFAEKLYTDAKYKKLLSAYEEGAPSIGDAVPELTGKTVEGSDHSAKDYSGKVYLIDFWAEWCGPCKMEMPNVIEVYNKYNPQGFEIIGVNLDKEDSKERALNYITENKLAWKHIFSLQGWEDPNVGNFKVTGIPATILVDKKGIIRYKYLRGKEMLSEKVEKLLSE